MLEHKILFMFWVERGESTKKNLLKRIVCYFTFAKYMQVSNWNKERKKDIKKLRKKERNKESKKEWKKKLKRKKEWQKKQKRKKESK